MSMLKSACPYLKRLGFYFTLICFPARMFEPLMPFSCCSFFTDVPCLRAIPESVSPFLMVTLCVVCLRRVDFLLLLAAAPRCLLELLTLVEACAFPRFVTAW